MQELKVKHQIELHDSTEESTRELKDLPKQTKSRKSINEQFGPAIHNSISQGSIVFIDDAYDRKTKNSYNQNKQK